jgi:hypothetical protein
MPEINLRPLDSTTTPTSQAPDLMPSKFEAGDAKPSVVGSLIYGMYVQVRKKPEFYLLIELRLMTFD